MRITHTSVYSREGKLHHELWGPFRFGKYFLQQFHAHEIQVPNVISWAISGETALAIPPPLNPDTA